MIKLTGLWRHTTKDGAVYYKGKLGQTKVLVSQNTRKTNDKQPDFQIYLDQGLSGELETKTTKKKTSWSTKSSIDF